MYRPIVERIYLASRSPRCTKGKVHEWSPPVATDGTATPADRPREPRSPRRYGRGDANKREELLEAAIYI